MSEAQSVGTLSTEELFRQHAPFVARFLGRLGVPSAHVEDALQEVFLVVHRQGGYRPGPAKPTSYLAGIAIRAATKHRRTERARRSRDSDTGVETLASDDADPRRALETREGLQRLQAALDRLPEELCVTLILAELEGESCLSIAAAMGLPVGTVYWRVHQARKKFQLALKQLDAASERPKPPVAVPARSGRRLGESSFGMIMVFSMRSTQAEMEQLLLLGRASRPSYPWLERSFARHQELVQSGSPLPPWAADAAQTTTSWVTLLGGGAVGTTVAVGVAAVVALVVLRPAQPSAQPRPKSERVVAAVAATSTQPSATAAQQARASSEHEALVPVVAPAPEQKPANAARAAASVRPHERTAALARAVAPTRRAATEPASAAVQPAPPAAEVVEPQPVSSHDPKQELLEMQEVAQAERLLATRPERALALVAGMQSRFPHGYFREERAYVEVMALVALGRREQAHAKATRFLQSYPNGPYSRRVRAGALDAARLEP